MNGGTEEQPIIVTLYTKIAGIYRIKGDLTKAIENITKVYDLMKKMFGKKDFKTNKAFKNLGTLYMENSEIKKAQAILKKYV